MEVEVIDVDDEHLVGSYSALLVLWWGARTMPEKLKKVIEQARTFIEPWSRIAVLVVVEPNSELPNKESRKLLEQLSHILIPKAVAVCYVFEGSGIRASATRTLMTALVLAGASAKQHRVVNTLDQALDWFVPIMAAPEFGSETERRKAVYSLERSFNEYRARGAST